jgi:PiT family inorganic phosphate transporter
MTGLEPLILFGIILALALNFVNGLNDASHSIATVVATRALSPIKAVFFTAICNMVGPFLFTTAVAATIGTAIVTQSGLTPLSIVVAMGASISLVFVATRAGIPLSSSHALVGGLLGAGIAVGGLSAVILPGWSVLAGVIIYGLIGAVAGAIVLGLFMV